MLYSKMRSAYFFTSILSRLFLNKYLLILPALPLAGCVSLPNIASNTATNNPTLVRFTTDGCSLFLNGTFNHPQAWCHCCVVHDQVYWRGGTEAERREADIALKQCVAKEGYSSISNIMWLGVRALGGPQFNTTFRWGYGWNYLRPYQALTVEEDAKAKELMAEYESKRP